MATTAEISIGLIALMVNTVAILISYFVGDVMLGPLLDIAAKWNINPILKQGMWETTYVYPYFFAILLIFEVIIIVAFVIILARRQVSPFDY